MPYEIMKYQKGLPHPWNGLSHKKRPRTKTVEVKLQLAWYRIYKEELHKKQYHLFDKTPEGKRLRKLRKQQSLPPKIKYILVNSTIRSNNHEYAVSIN